MKLLRITAEGLPLFKEKLDLSFYAQQRVAEEQKNILYPLFSNIYMNSATGFIGINASGKTSVLKVILLALDIINNEPINHIETRDILGDAKEVKLNKYKEYKKSRKKPSDFCKEDLRMADVKSYRFVKSYFADPMVLVAAIKKHHEISKVPKGEYTLLDLLR